MAGLAAQPRIGRSDRAITGARLVEVTAPDGLMLAAWAFEPRVASPLPPVLCLPGLTRNARDFAALAIAISQGSIAPRQVIAIDMRGRGASDWATDPTQYDLMVELGDINAVIAALGITRAAVVGTSRGGIHAMLLALTRPGFLTHAILNDIGSVIEPEGLLRIKGYVGAAPPLPWPVAVEALKRGAEREFPALSGDEWRRFAQQLFVDAGGLAALDYDPALARTLDAVVPGMAPIDLAQPFAALAPIPTLVLRGRLSTLLSEATLARMALVHPRLRMLRVDQEGHAPLLWDATTQAAIKAHLAPEA